MDFTLTKYAFLLKTLKYQGFLFQSFSGFVSRPAGKTIILRHDADRLPVNSLISSKIEAKLGIRGTYYFRIFPESFDRNIIQEIYQLGHEIGYHYEDVSIAPIRHRAPSFSKLRMTRQGVGRRDKINMYEVDSKEYEEFEKELVDIAIESFSENLEKLRKIVPVKTICMHGSPMSSWDSRLLWKYYDYRDFGIVGEPYFDIDFDRVLYLTDTGRRWDGESLSIRDKATGIVNQASGENPYRDWKVKPFKYRQITQDIECGMRHAARGTRHAEPETRNPEPRTAHRTPFPTFRSTSDIIKAAEEGGLPDKIMMTFHPQRWTDKPVPWVRELVWQNVKNTGKYFLVKFRSQAK